MTASKNSLPRALYDAASVRALDAIAISDFEIAGFTLMQRAGAAVLQCMQERWPQTKNLLIFAGPGNNGGDGYVIAALAKEQGLNPTVFRLGNHKVLSGDALLASQYAQKLDVAINPVEDVHLARIDSFSSQHTVIVDAMLGTGIDRPVSDDFEAIISRINQLPFPVVAVDIPSGLCSDTGNEYGKAVIADMTVTFIGMKQGLLTHRAVDLCGQLIYHSLNVPDKVFCAPNSPAPCSHRIDIQQMQEILAPRRNSSHKGDHGHVVVMGGDLGFGGAAIMAAEAALMSGAGLVSLITRACHLDAALSRRPELMVLVDDDILAIESLLDRATVIVIGPGLGTSAWSRRLLQAALHRQANTDSPLVVDADALNLLAERDAAVVGLKRDNWVLTPHPGEAARMLTCSTADVQADRFQAVSKLQSLWGGCCLLKGAGSLLCYEQNCTQKIDLCTEGNPGMASGGMGDVLSGIIGGFLAQGMSLSGALRSGVCVHGEAADLAAQHSGQRGMLATDLFPYLRQLINPAGQVY